MTVHQTHAQTILVEIDGPILVVTIDRLDADPQLAVGILTGAAGHFSSGMDLKAFLAGERVELDGRGLAGICQTPPAKPLIAAVEGYALAGGCEIALACDLIVASNEARFGIPEVKTGLIAGSGGLVRLPQRVPRQIAMEYALTGRMMTAAEAHHFGLVNTLTEPGKALDAARDLAREIAANAPLSIAMTKRIVNEAGDWPAGEIWTRQRALLEEIIASDDAREGARAFSEKRRPVWQGR
jgi:enoyl-CoA hydratase